MVSLSDPERQSALWVTMAILPKVTGLISLISSAFIIHHVIRDRKRCSQVYHRLLLGMSTSDFFGSFTRLSLWSA